MKLRFGSKAWIVFDYARKIFGDSYVDIQNMIFEQFGVLGKIRFVQRHVVDEDEKVDYEEDFVTEEKPIILRSTFVRLSDRHPLEEKFISVESQVEDTTGERDPSLFSGAMPFVENVIEESDLGSDDDLMDKVYSDLDSTLDGLGYCMENLFWDSNLVPKRESPIGLRTGAPIDKAPTMDDYPKMDFIERNLQADLPAGSKGKKWTKRRMKAVPATADEPNFRLWTIDKLDGVDGGCGKGGLQEGRANKWAKRRMKKQGLGIGESVENWFGLRMSNWHEKRKASPCDLVPRNFVRDHEPRDGIEFGQKSTGKDHHIVSPPRHLSKFRSPCGDVPPAPSEGILAKNLEAVEGKRVIGPCEQWSCFGSMLLCVGHPEPFRKTGRIR
jgi:hypothetical protein